MTDSTTKTFKKWETLIREGEVAKCAYVIESGSVEILVHRGNDLIQIGTRGPGSIIGEMAIIDDKPRTATVRALEKCTVMEISREDFAHRLESADPILKMVMHVVMARYRDMISRSHFAQSFSLLQPSAETIENSSKLHDTAVGALKIHNELRAAFDNNELLLHYQPIIDLQSMKIAGFEALMRWKHPERGMIPPGIFIPVAEESRLIISLSRWAMGVSCDAVKVLQKEIKPSLAGPHPLFVSVNFSAKDFSESDFLSNIKSTLRAKDVDPVHIHMEITEGLLMESPDAAKAALEKCRQNGLSISIDDFGTGYSSLGYLHHFPIDTLKIDRSFVQSITSKSSSLPIVKSIVALAHNMNMKVIAEGIETQEEASILKELGCEECQGYWFSKPLPFEDALKFVQNWNPPKIS